MYAYRWSYLLYQILIFYLTGMYAEQKLWDVVSTTVIIFQNAAILEASTKVLRILF